MKNKLTLILTLIILTITLTACGGGGNGSGKKSKSDSPSNQDVNAGYNSLEPQDAMAKIDKSKSCLNAYSHTMDFTKHPSGHYQNNNVVAKFVCTDADIKALLNTQTGGGKIELKNLDIYLLNDVVYDVSSQYNTPAIKDAQRELDNVYIEGNTHTITLQGMNPDNAIKLPGDTGVAYHSWSYDPTSNHAEDIKHYFRQAPLFNEVKGGSILSNVTVLVKDMVLIDGFIGTASQTTLNNLNLKRTVGVDYGDAGLMWFNLLSVKSSFPAGVGLNGHFKAITERDLTSPNFRGKGTGEETSSLIKQADATVNLNSVNCDAMIAKGNGEQGNKFACLLPSVANQIGSANRVGSTFLELDDEQAENFGEHGNENPIITH